MLAILKSQRTAHLNRGNALTRTIVWMRGRLRQRPDSEHEMTYNRLVLNAIVIVYLAVVELAGFSDAQYVFDKTIPLSIAYGTASMLIFAHILWRNGECPGRRVVAMVVDLAAITYCMHIGEEATAWLYPFLLWTIFGNGFRFGNRYLFMASGTAIAAFFWLMTYNPFWSQHPSLTWGSLAGLLTLPAYVSVLIKKLSEAKQQAEEANRAKSLFLAGVSHELRTPLNAVIGLSDLLMGTRLDHDQTDMTRTIGEAGRTLLNLINSILDLSRLEVGKMPMTKDEVDLPAILHRIRNMVAVGAQAKGVRLALHVDAATPRHILASSRQIEEVVTNLVSNAVKFTSAGSVLIDVAPIDATPTSVTLRLEVTDTGIGIAESAQAKIFERFTQADETIVDRFGGTGLGLALARQMVESHGGRIGVSSQLGVGSCFWFEQTFDLCRPGEDENAGLQVANPVLVVSSDMRVYAAIVDVAPQAQICDDLQSAAQLLKLLHNQRNGRPIVFIDRRSVGSSGLEAAEKLTEGEVFGDTQLIEVLDQDQEIEDAAKRYFISAIERPVTRTAISNVFAIVLNQAAAVGDRLAIGAGTRRECTVLLADDNVTNQKVVSRILEKLGHRVTVVNNGQAALEALTEGMFDLALMDINMPVLNGVEAARLYTFATMGREAIPIFALTADVTEQTRQRCLDAGMVSCLSKPIEPARLGQIIDEFMRDRKSVLETILTQEREIGVKNETHAAAQPLETADPIDRQAISDLEDLGGREFVSEVVTQFVSEATAVLQNLSRAVAEQDVSAFRDQVHALRSGAANVGARRMYERCLAWRQIDAYELAREGEYRVRELENEFETAREGLSEYVG